MLPGFIHFTSLQPVCFSVWSIFSFRYDENHDDDDGDNNRSFSFINRQLPIVWWPFLFSFFFSLLMMMMTFFFLLLVDINFYFPIRQEKRLFQTSPVSCFFFCHELNVFDYKAAVFGFYFDVLILNNAWFEQ